jgi:6-phosphogluconolactonase
MYWARIRRTIQTLFAAALILATFGWSGGSAAAAANQVGAVYTLINSTAGDAVVAWGRASDGTLTPAGTYATGGNGIAGGLGSQGALVLSQDHKWLFAVNAGSNTISTFRVNRDGLTLLGQAASGGERPISITIARGLLYVLNAGGSGNIAGFAIGNDGALSPIAGATLPLSGTSTNPAQVQFSPAGDLLVVTEKATNRLDVYGVDADGRASGPAVYPSSGGTPFGFAFGKRGQIFVSEASGGANGLSAASSYDLSGGNLSLVSGSVPTNQGAACWVVVTNDGRYAYTANAGSGSISGFSIGIDGSITLLNADGRTGVTGDNSGPADMALSVNSQFLYVRNGRNGTLGAFAVQPDGSLQSLPGVGGVPAGNVGLAAY